MFDNSMIESVCNHSRNIVVRMDTSGMFIAFLYINIPPHIINILPYKARKCFYIKNTLSYC